MSVRLTDITEDMVAEDQIRFPRVFSMTLKEKAIRTLVMGGGTLILLYGLNRFGFFSDKFWGSLGKLWTMFGQMFPPTGWDQIDIFAHAIGETLAMAIIGSLIGGILALPFACMASKNLMPIRPIQFSFRRFADVLRSADYLIWGLVFVRALGLGPVSGIMAIIIIDTGILITLYSEALENIDRKPIDGIKASGGGRLQVLRFGVMPQVLPVLLSNALYMFESNTRAATILGIVGAGGIGFLLSDNLRAFEFSNACTIILMIIAVVYVIDYMSKKLRERFIHGDRVSQGHDRPMERVARKMNE
ncbi:MAG: phosphonate ABC transporter, permease protein PhnE [Magnetovibrio sp.]|nr:phosphonate ABC transporter, permease protein PhnE [Magnetovibrio sp.]|tara:strand:+ start:69 stop:977 length:909 start_codon:yes stop_codon:yes gene_type:complete